jgi:hypothetical protein
MADLSQLMQIAPTTAAGFMGVNQAQNRQMNEQKMMELAELMKMREAEEQRKQSMHPFELDKMRLNNETSQAQLPGLIAQSQIHQQNAQFGRDTLGGKTNKTNSDNQSEVIKNAFRNIGMLSDVVQTHDDLARALPALGIPQEFQPKMMEHFGKFQGPALNQEMKRISEAILRSDPVYTREIEQERMRQEGALKRANVLAQNRIDVKGKGGKKDPDGIMEWYQAETKGKNAETRFAITLQYIQRAEAAGMTELAESLREEAAVLKPLIDAKINQPRAGTPDMGRLSNDRIPTNPPADIPIPGRGAPQAKPAAGNSADLRKAIAGAGWTYEPDKYDYRIAPDGVAERKLKGK